MAWSLQIHVLPMLSFPRPVERDRFEPDAGSTHRRTTVTVPDKISKATCLRLPDHVVYRSFAEETVILNLETARYHGLNRSGGYMLAVLEQSHNLGAAAETIAEHYDEELDIVSADLITFCEDLLDRGLLEVVDG